jgi:hypothetical protein
LTRCLQPHPAGAVEHGLTVVELQMLVEPDADGGLSQDRDERGYHQLIGVTHPRQEPYAGKPHVRIWAGGVP